MSLNLGQDRNDFTVKERTWRMEFFCERGEPAEFRAHREIVKVDRSGADVARERESVTVQRLMSDIGDRKFTAEGKTVTGNQLAALMAAAADALRAEDIKRAEDERKAIEDAERAAQRPRPAPAGPRHDLGPKPIKRKPRGRK